MSDYVSGKADAHDEVRVELNRICGTQAEEQAGDCAAAARILELLYGPGRAFDGETN